MIYVGTCGFSYKDWVGPFYPGKIKPAEMLPFYSRRFRAVEIDSSYYGVPSEASIEAMHARTPADFRFSFKAPQTVTHAPEGGRARLHPDAVQLRERLEPLREAGKLAAVLLQFPNGFKPGNSSQKYVRDVATGFEGVPLVAEFRHRDWQTPATFDFLRELNVGWCNVDLPRYDVLPLPSSDATTQVGYVRMHGRNAAMWWVGDNVTRYNYAYDANELATWTERITEISELTQETFVFFNNHANGQAAASAELLDRLLEERYGEELANRTIARPTLTPAPQQGVLPGLT